MFDSATNREKTCLATKDSWNAEYFCIFLCQPCCNEVIDIEKWNVFYTYFIFLDTAELWPGIQCTRECIKFIN